MQYAIFQIMRHAIHLNAELAFTKLYLDGNGAKK
jgi:hypothetical protein